MKKHFEQRAANQNALIFTDLERQLKSMAAAPQGKQAHAAPRPTQAAAKSSQRDGLLGGMLLDCLFGLPLSDAFAGAADIADEGTLAVGAGMAVDLYDEFRRDRLPKNRTNGRGVEMGVSGSLKGMFNRPVGALTDAPRRLNLEDQYAAIARMKRPPGLYMAA